MKLKLSLTCLIISAFLASSRAQDPNSCTVTGRIFRPDGSPASGEVVHLIKLEQQGNPVTFTPFDVQADSNGLVTFNIRRNSEVWVQANNVDGLNVTGGVPLQIPDSATAQFELLWHATDGVTTFNGRAGDVTLFDTDVSNALGYTPVNPLSLQLYAALGGKPGGQTLSGGSQSQENLRLQSTSNGTKGKILFGNSGYDEANNWLGIGTNAPSDSIETTGHIRVGVEKGVRFQSQGTPFSIHVGSGFFNGTRDDVLYLAYNLQPGGVWQKVDQSEPQLKFGMEANYYPGPTHQMEWNFDYVSADGGTYRRPLAFKIDRINHSANWLFSQNEFGIADDYGVQYASFDSQRGLTMPRNGFSFWDITLDRRSDAPGDSPFPAFRPKLVNRSIDFGVMPNGSPATLTHSAFSLWNTDYRSDRSNYERLVFYARTNGYVIQSEGAGTGVARPIAFQNNALVVAPNTNRIGVGTASPTSTLHVSGSFATNVVTKTSNYTATEADAVILVNSTSAPVQITFPSAQGILGRQYVVKKVDNTTKTVTIATTNNQTIDGTPTKTLSSPFQTIRVVSDGSNWLVL